MTKNLIAPSILSGDFVNMSKSVDEIQKFGLDWVHCDVMDGIYVPNISFGMPMVRAVRNCTELPLDVHLMITKPETYGHRFMDAGADLITFHPEASDDALKLLKGIRDRGVKAGLAISPDISVNILEPYFNYLDIVVIMGVHPGYSGQKLIPASLDKVSMLRGIRDIRNLDFLIEFDGGVTFNNAAQIKSLGADVLVAGSSFFDAVDKATAAKALKAL